MHTNQNKSCGTFAETSQTKRQPKSRSSTSERRIPNTEKRTCVRFSDLAAHRFRAHLRRRRRNPTTFSEPASVRTIGECVCAVRCLPYRPVCVCTYSRVHWPVKYSFRSCAERTGRARVSAKPTLTMMTTQTRSASPPSSASGIMLRWLCIVCVLGLCGAHVAHAQTLYGKCERPGRLSAICGRMRACACGCACVCELMSARSLSAGARTGATILTPFRC